MTKMAVLGRGSMRNKQHVINTIIYKLMSLNIKMLHHLFKEISLVLYLSFLSLHLYSLINRKRYEIKHLNLTFSVKTKSLDL